MKELSIEEKAKRYDETIEMANSLLIGDQSEDAWIYRLLPELQEDVDEKIREELKSLFQDCIGGVNHRYTGSDARRWLAWLEKQGERNEECKEINLVEILKHYPKETELFSPLYGKLWLAEVDEENEIITCYRYPLEEDCTRAVIEQEDTVSFYSNGTTGLPDFSISKDCMLFLYDKEKQGEQKPTDKVEPKFKVGDWITNNCAIWFIEDIDNGLYSLKGPNGGVAKNVKLKTISNNFHIWTIQDAKDGDVLVASDNSIFLFKCVDDYSCKHYVALTTDNVVQFNVGLEHYWETSRGVHPATHEQRDILFTKMKEIGYEWDVEDKVLKKVGQKPAWSEEDEQMLQKALSTIRYALSIPIDKEDDPCFVGSSTISWLKSIKEQMKGR